MFVDWADGLVQETGCQRQLQDGAGRGTSGQGIYHYRRISCTTQSSVPAGTNKPRATGMGLLPGSRSGQGAACESPGVLPGLGQSQV